MSSPRLVAFAVKSKLRGIEVDIHVTDITVRLGWKLNPDDSWEKLGVANRARSEADKCLRSHNAKSGQRWLVQISGEQQVATKLE